MTAVEARRQAFDISRVVNGTFGPLTRNPGVFFGLAALLSGVPSAAMRVFQVQLQMTLLHVQTEGAANPAAVGGAMMSSGSLMFAMGLVTLALSGVLQAALVYGVVEDLNGRRANFGDCLSAGFRFALPVVAISILFGLGIGVGFVLLIVPGVYLLIRWIVAVPAEVVERTGVFAAFARSRDLVRGSGWGIFALLLVFLVLAMVVQGVISAVLMALFLGIGGFSRANISAVASVSAIASVLISILVAPLGAAGVASIYVELRTLKEGADPTSLAAVFD